MIPFCQIGLLEYSIQGVKGEEWDDKKAKEVSRNRKILDQQDCNHL